MNQAGKQTKTKGDTCPFHASILCLFAGIVVLKDIAAQIKNHP
jgi:hypothetical protein